MLPFGSGSYNTLEAIERDFGGAGVAFPYKLLFVDRAPLANDRCVCVVCVGSCFSFFRSARPTPPANDRCGGLLLSHLPPPTGPPTKSPHTKPNSSPINSALLSPRGYRQMHTALAALVAQAPPLRYKVLTYICRSGVFHCPKVSFPVLVCT